MSNSARGFSAAQRAISKPPSYEKNLKQKPPVSLSLFGFFFSEIIKQLMEETATLKKQGKGDIEF